MTNRRTFLTSAGAAVLPRGLRAAGARPNLLVIMTDQQFAEAMSCRLGPRYIRTPHMDSLAASGMLFSRTYCANPLCVPSRTSMFTGYYPAQTGYQTNDLPPIDARRFPMMGGLFRAAGYDTGYYGKWHVPFPQGETGVHGFTNTARSKAGNDEGVAKSAAAFLRQRRQAPFLLVASFLNPHNICQWARGEGLPEGPIAPLPPVDQCPPVRPNLEVPRNETDTMILMRRSYQGTPTFPVGNFDEKKWRQYIWAYYRMIEKVDGCVGQVLQALRETGQEERTVVVFTADHGDCQGAHRWNQKTALYEESARVPLIISQKGVTKAGVARRLAHTGVDLVPTLCDYAGIPIPRGLPGLSLKETANGGGDRDPREFVVTSNRMAQGAEINGRVPVPDGRMLRSQRYKYCVYSEGQRRESLVDLEKDPGEMVNLAEDPAHRATLNAHRKMLASWCRQVGDKFPLVTA
jgi:arylsulfatase A-like enzyme